MLTNYHTLAYIAAGLNMKLHGQTVAVAFTQHRDELVLRFEGIEEALVVSCDRNFNTMYLRPNFSRALTNSMDVLEGCTGQKIETVRIHAVDRVVMVALHSGDRLDARFFGAKANVVLCDEKEIVVDAFKDSRAVVGTKAEYRSGEIMYDVESLREILGAAKHPTALAALKEALPTLGATLVKEILHRAEISSTSNPTALHVDDVQKLRRAFIAVLSDLASPLVRVYVDDDGSPKQFSIVPLLQHADFNEKRFTDVHEAIRFFVSRTRSREFVDDEKRSIVGKLQHKLSKAKRTVEAVEHDVATSGRADEYQKFGELLMAHAGVEQRAKSKGQRATSVVLNGVEVPLQPELTLIQNAQRHFEKAKRARAALQQATERRRELQATIASAERLLALLDDVNSKTDLTQFMAEHNDELEQFGVGKKSEEREQLPFRVFTVDGGFEVWAGKSSKNNDELTLKHAKPNDLWFHARGAAGSHVVLKTNSGKGEPSKKAREQAASIAAYYSKMKNAKMVPVAMTEKKFVRKPKGAAPGSVAVEREKVIFAEPALPHEEKRKKAK
jgi:predicted ribosome quality control (RQC) complex YloA/Tae2 family protein